MDLVLQLLQRIERKVDFMLQLQGMTLVELSDLNDAIETNDDAKMQRQIDKLSTSTDALKAAVVASKTL